MTRAARLACLTLFAATTLAAPAAAQAPSVDQYSDDAPVGAVAGERTSGSNPAATGATGTGTAAGSQSRSAGAGTAAAATTTLRLAFGGGASRKLASAIDAALVQGGIEPSIVGRVTRDRVERFLGTPLAADLADGDAQDVGRAVAQLIVDPDPRTPAVLEALLGYALPLAPATHAVFTRSTAPSGRYAAFQKGIVEGSSDVPSAYAELSTATRSFVKAFDALRVPTVDDVDTAAGRSALVAILVAGAEGNFGGKPTADAKLVDGDVKPISTGIGGGSGDGRLAYGLLALVVVAVLWSALGLGPRRGARR